MQKIIIKNFGPVKDAEIEIKKVLILIGEQASGKSTIAKLIYFFKTLRRELAILDFHAMDINLHFSSSTREIFYNFFGSKLISPDFQIIFYYNLENDKYLRLNFDKSKEVCAEFSVNFFDDDFKSKFQSYIKNSQNFNDKDEEPDLLFYDSQELIRLLNDVFENTQVNPPLFVIAGRNITVSHSDLFEKYFFADVINRLDQDSIEEQVDNKLIFDFIKKVSLTKDRLKRFGGFKGLIERQRKNTNIKEYLKTILSRINKIMKGEYSIDNDGEKIILDNQEKIYLNNASSGQQEVIRILQDIFMIFDQNLKVLRIIEEPEAHLFPIAQKQLIELLALMVNYQPENQLIITTHSPYILTVFNHLLFASRVVAKNPAAEAEVNEIVDKDCWLDPDEFSAYSLGNESFPEDNAAYCEPIFDQEKGMLQQNYLDTVSEILGWEFSKLYSIHGKTFKRR